MGKGKTVPRDGKGRTNKANNPPQIKTFKDVVLSELKKRKEQKEGRRDILDKFKELRKTLGGKKDE